MSGKMLVHPLQGEQAEAVDPGASVWLSASAGTGKTQVLSARVLRLLLQEGVGPESLLCLTFTKAGAAEMATRVHQVLARWVRLDAANLAQDLKAIGARHDPATQARARTLFAKVLDCPGGGLRIDTIHAFSQWLLAAFPQEAGLLPGTRALDDRERALLAREVLSELVANATQYDRDALAMLSIRHAPDGARAWLMRCAEAIDLWTGPNGWQPPMRERVLQLLGLPSDCDEEQVAAGCNDATFDIAALHQCRASYGEWKAKSGSEAVAAAERWLGLDPHDRLREIDRLREAFFFKNGKPRLPKNTDDAFASAHARIDELLSKLKTQMALLALAEYLEPALTLGRKFALAWHERKQRDGLIDFDDQIRHAARLLRDEGLGRWIAYKLDRQFDHVLVDEAQDTNEAQWDIIRALTSEFFTGLGQRDAKLRTIFVVGDYKQAIFGFQGTSPQNFARQKEVYRKEIETAITNARQLADETRSVPLVNLRELQVLGLGRSYRTAQDVLDFVDRAIAAIGAEAIGLDTPPEPHIGDAHRPGLVGMWQPVVAAPSEDDTGDDSWLGGPERAMADRIAAQVREWLDPKGLGHPLAKGEHRRAEAGDIMILVRKRKELAGLIVARLHAAGVPVAGVDRLRLGAPLAVKDLMAALRFAAQPLDDLSLASLLVSPLGEWSQDDLLEYGYRETSVRLWDHLRRSDKPFAQTTVAKLRLLLERVDFEPPESMLHWILTGPWQGRRKLVARLGHEANDPIDELVNAAFAYSSVATASLQGFIQWFDAGDGELKREQGGDDGLVRVMTVHGSKGLQAPIVILADATGNPDRTRASDLKVTEETSGQPVPLPTIPTDERHGPVAAAQEELKRLERQEHWRLLYVAMTRAEEALYIGGALGMNEKDPAEDSWYARLAPLFTDAELADPVWGARREIGRLPDPVVPSADTARTEETTRLPKWAQTPVGPEPRPPRPLAPSSAGEDRSAKPPLPSEQGAIAARRGVLIHKLLERMPEVEHDLRKVAASQWLERHAKDLDSAEREEILVSTIAVLDHSEFAAIFGRDALAEVPLAATVGGQVIAGTADRLLVCPTEVTVVDFKTTRRPPDSLDAIPDSVVRQMAAYVAALERIYPERSVKAAVLYTHTPDIFALPDDLLAPHKAALQS
ncbi:MAG: double-strand break repair helicase AddA [Sphingomonadaceae bacterium]|nr:MAG: double-strand break repair helicase AddA [Sphingomonadaceae bacterium]